MAEVTITIDNENVTGTVKDLNRGVTVPLKSTEPATINATHILITLTTNDGFIFNSVGFWDDDGEYVAFSISTDGKTATLDTYVYFSELNIIAKTTAVEQPEPPEVTITIDDENVTGTVKDLDSGVTVPLKSTEPATINATHILITLTTNEGFVFDKVGGYIDGEYVTFSISADNKTATFETNVEYSTELVIVAKTIVEQPEPPEGSDGVTGFNHLYLVDKTILKSIGEERFGVSNGENVIDLGEYILNVLELPFEIDDSIKGLKTPIKLGNYLLKTEAIELIDDEININLGEIYVPNKYYNVYDYVNTNIYLHLPFSEKIELDVEYVINETVGINYIIDLYTGETTINITSSKIDGNIIHSKQLKIGRNIPFIRKSGDITGEITQNNGLNNKIYKPFIEVIRNKPYEMDNPFNDDIIVKTKLIHEKGYVVVDNIILNINGSLEEKERIITTLRGGVYIK